MVSRCAIISTLCELFRGRKELFEGLYIHDKWDWTKTYPVVHLDFRQITYSTAEELKISLNKFIELTCEDNKIKIDKEFPLSLKFAEIIKKLHEKAWSVVILVDEYDKTADRKHRYAVLQ